MGADTNATGFAMAAESAFQTAAITGWRKLEVNNPTQVAAQLGQSERDPISTDRNRRKGGTTSLRSGFAFDADATFSHLIDFAPYFLFVVPNEPGTTGKASFPVTAAVDGGGGDDSFTVTADAAVEVWQVDASGGPSYVDETADFNSATDADFNPFPATEAVGDYIAFGAKHIFTEMVFDNANGTAGTVGAGTWEYWNGTAWTALAGVTDGTTGFTAATSDGQVLSFTKPADWAKTTINGGASLYFIRFRVTTVYTVNPVYDQGWIGKQAKLTAGELVYARGLTNTQNNALFVVQAGATPTSVPVPTASLVAEATPPANAELEVAGVQGGSGDFEINASGNLKTTTLDMTTLGWLPGMYLKLGGAAAATQFATAANNGWCRIVSVAANETVLDRTVSNVGVIAGFATDAGAGKTIQVLYGRFYRNVDIYDYDYEKSSATFEVTYNFDAATEYSYPDGNYGNSLTLQIPLEDKMTLSTGWVGGDVPKNVTVRKTGPSAALEPNRTEMLDGMNSVPFIHLLTAAGADIGMRFRSLNMTLLNNLTPEHVLGQLGAVAIPAGNIHVDLDAEVLFEKSDVSDAIRDNDTLGYHMAIKNGDGAMVLDVGECTAGDGSLNFERNVTIRQAMPLRAHKDAQLGYSVSVSMFPYVP